MCEYCGCQALEAIALLTAEHDAVVAPVGRARHALDRGARDGDAGRDGDGGRAEAARLAGEIAGLLAPHTAVEERGLFPALAGDFPWHVAHLVDQHRRIDAALERAARQEGDWVPALRVALDELREHILAEQDGVFPAALAHLAPSDWEALARIRATVEDSTSTKPLPQAPVRL